MIYHLQDALQRNHRRQIQTYQATSEMDASTVRRNDSVNNATVAIVMNEIESLSVNIIQMADFHSLLVTLACMVELCL